MKLQNDTFGGDAVVRSALLAARKKSGLTQREVAEAVRISRCFYSLIENEARMPSAPVAFRIAQLFGQPAERFFLPANVSDGIMAVDAGAAEDASGDAA